MEQKLKIGELQMTKKKKKLEMSSGSIPGIEFPNGEQTNDYTKGDPYKEIEEENDNIEIVVDAIIETPGGIVLIWRRYPPYGWAFPGGHIEFGETNIQAVTREVKEETNLDIFNIEQFKTYNFVNSDSHFISIVFTAKSKGFPIQNSDAKRAKIFPTDQIPFDMMVDEHAKILGDYFNVRDDHRESF